MAASVDMRHEKAGTMGEVKETIESIVVALILAFVFRAFIVEAFVIPTGSMAPTLYGAHGTIVCDDCGTEFSYGLRDLADSRTGRVVGAGARAICPNCNHENTGLRMTDAARNPESGDRILVMKWPLDIGGAWFAPARWDVTVFKDPADGTTNFIKRLIGLPNELLMILDGDIYTAPVEEISAKTLEELESLRHQKYLLRTQQANGRLPALSFEAKNELNDKFKIAPKTDIAQRSLWQPVYDHDHLPRTLGSGQPRWEPLMRDSSAWDATHRVIRYSGGDEKRDGIKLTGKRLAGQCAYNIADRRPPLVSDFQISFVFTPESADSEVRVRLSKMNRVFWGIVNTNGSVSIVESPDPPAPSSPVMLSGQIDPLSPGDAVHIIFEHVDYRLSLSVAETEVLASSRDPNTPGYYEPSIYALRRLSKPIGTDAPQIFGLGDAFTLTHVNVRRDVFYFHDASYQALGLYWAPRGGWASPDYPILLRSYEYFMLGDNTSASKDSRLWDTLGEHMAARGEEVQLGAVPKDQLIGKAFFVYWPSPHRLEWLPSLRFGVVPDVGRMRWIR